MALFLHDRENQLWIFPSVRMWNEAVLNTDTKESGQ